MKTLCLGLGLVLAVVGCTGDNTDPTSGTNYGIIQAPRSVPDAVKRDIIRTLANVQQTHEFKYGLPSISLKSEVLCGRCTLTVVAGEHDGSYEVYDDQTGDSLGEMTLEPSQRF